MVLKRYAQPDTAKLLEELLGHGFNVAAFIIDEDLVDADDARIELFDYIEGYYNNHHKHSSLGYKTPNQFESSISSPN